MTIVIKVGTNILTNENGELHVAHLQHIADQIFKIKVTLSQNVVLVTSGAINMWI